MYRMIQRCRMLCYLVSAVFFAGFLIVIFAVSHVQAATATARIHVLAFPGNDEAVLLESRDSSGKKIFGLVDCGEDWDYPDGSDERYPLRSGIVTSTGYDEEVLSYLSSVGVNANNLEFIVATHPHSDHIGLADTLIQKYHPKRVYLMEYNDSYVTDTSRLWDNLYVYDQTVQAAMETSGVTLIQHLTPDASVEDGSPNFSLGAFRLQIVNYDEDYMTSPKSDANQFCLGVIASANGHRAFLSSDIDNTEQTDSTPGDLDRIVSDYDLYNIDMVTSNHHGYDNAMDVTYLNNIHPDYFIQDGIFQIMTAEKTSLLADMNARIFSTGAYSDSVDAIVVDFSGSTVTSNVDNTYAIYTNSAQKRCAYYDGLPYTGLFTYNGTQYCGDENGILRTSTTWINPDDGMRYVFDASGAVTEITETLSWVKENGNWYYRYSGGKNYVGWAEYDGNMYYMDANGVMVTGWKKIDEKWYYFASWGGMQKGWIFYDKNWYYLDRDTGVMASGGWLCDPDTSKFYYLYSWGGCYRDTSKSLNGYTVTFNSRGEVSSPVWITTGGKWYYLKNGAYTTGWQKVNDKWYYLNSDGTRKQNESFEYDNNLYFVNSNGVMYANQWVEWNGKWYYPASWGGAVKGQWLHYDDNWYYLNDDGTMKSNEAFIYDNNLYFVRSWGGMYCSEWIKWDDKWYYALSWGGAAKNQWIYYKNNWYYLGADAVMCTGWLELNGKTYYLRSWGGRVTGEYTIDGVKYTFGMDGVLIK